MRPTALAFALALLGGAGYAHAQSSYDPSPFVSRVDVAGGYDFIRANAPPSGQPRFSGNGGFAGVGYNFKYWLAAAGEFNIARSSNISPLGQNLLLMTFAGGPRVTLHPGQGRTAIFGQAMFGEAHAGDSYFPTSTGSTTSATSFAYTTGGGADYQFTHSWAARVQGQYLHTGFPNGVSNIQHHLLLGVGVVYKIHGHYSHPKIYRSAVPEPAAAPTPEPPPPPAPAAAEPLPTPTVVVVPQPPPPDNSVNGVRFRENVKDAFFDYDKADLRPDTQQTIVRNAEYLNAHPEIHILIGGYSDERGAVDYNLALGEKRATAARDALIAAGVDGGRLTVVSFGKGVQFCTKDDETCFQRNRRAAFMLQP